MLPIRPTSQFKKDLKRAARQGRNLKKVEAALEILSKPQPLSDDYKDHKLKGTWRDFRECHIEPDWLLIYTLTDFELRPTRLGTHAELFDQPGRKHPVLITPRKPALRTFGPMTVPEGHYFMMGDNRDISGDSRYFGFVARDRIVGRATAIVISLNIQDRYQPRWERFFTKLP